MTTVRIAAAGAHFDHELTRALDRLEVVIGAGHYARAGLLVLPAGTLGGIPVGTAAPHPLDPDGPELRRVRQLAGAMIVCLGYTELDAGRPVNAAVCLHGDGVLGHYRQVHARPDGPDRATGDRIEAFDTPLGRLGLLLDVDKAFPEAARTLALDGATVIACLSAWPASTTQRSTRLPQDRQSRLFDLYDCARAAENQLVWVSANQTGALDGRRFLGQSKVVGPGGEVLARTAAKAGLAVAELDIGAAVAAARGEFDHLSGRRPELYREK
jgi:predicted amidohydrolase